MYLCLGGFIFTMAICNPAVRHLKEESDVWCCACRHKNKITVATNYCLDCNEHFCEECAEIHKVIPALLDHTINITAELQGESQTTFQRCKSHIGKKLDMYCLTHGKVVCYICISTEHRSCTLKLVTDGASTNTVEQITSQVTVDSPSIIRLQAARKIGEIKLAIRKLRELKHIMINDIKYFKKELCDWIDQLELTALNDTEFKCEELMNKWQVDADEIKTYMDESVSQESCMTTAEGIKYCEDGKILSVSEKCMLALSQKTKAVSPIIKCASFKPDKNLKKLKETLQELGVLELKFIQQDDRQTISETFAKAMHSTSTQTSDPQMQQLMPSNISPQTNIQVTSGPLCYPQQTLNNPSVKAFPQPYTHADGCFSYNQPAAFTYTPGTFTKTYVSNVQPQPMYYQYPSLPPPNVHAYGGFTGKTNASNGTMPTRSEAVSQAKQGTIAPTVSDLTASMLAAVPPNEQKLMLGEHLFPLIHRLYPDLAGKITGMLLEMENSALLHLLGNQERLKMKVEEAIAVLLAHQVKEAKEVFEAAVDK